MNSLVVRGLVITLTVILTACGPSSDLITSEPQYQPFTSKADKTSVLGGVSFYTNDADSTLSSETVSGTFSHRSGAITIKSGVNTLTDHDGFDNYGILESVNGDILVRDEKMFSNSYEYIFPYHASYHSADGEKLDSKGLIGIVTKPDDIIPMETIATYNGESHAAIITEAYGIDLLGGSSQLTANFFTGKANLLLHDFTAVDQTTGSNVSAPIDSIVVQGASISGGVFSDGNLETKLDDVAVNLTGTNTAIDVAGMFFGLDAYKSIPDEVGGTVLINGDAGTIVGFFVAD